MMPLPLLLCGEAEERNAERGASPLVAVRVVFVCTCIENESLPKREPPCLSSDVDIQFDVGWCKSANVGK